MNTLKLKTVEVLSSNEIIATFTHDLSKNINIDNVKLTSVDSYISDPQILSFEISGNTITINCQALKPFKKYKVSFFNDGSFTNVTGEIFLLKSDKENTKDIIGTIESDNVIFNNFKNNIKEPYDINSTDGILNKLFSGFSNVFSKALYNVRSLINDNYLTLDIIDELKTRGSGPFDRLNEENAYELLRVSKNKTNYVLSDLKSFNGSSSVICLSSKQITESLILENDDYIGCLNVKTLTLNTSFSPAIKLNSFTVTYLDGAVFNYDVEKYGYSLLDSKYDKKYASSNKSLLENQIKLNPNILNDGFSKSNIFKISASYEYNQLGKKIDFNTIEVYSLESKNREVLPPLVNTFFLSKPFIVDVNGDKSGLNGVLFDGLEEYTNSTHPAFKVEIPYKQDALPNLPGQYSIDYDSGQVFVYGEDSLQTGTGVNPPVASYLYKQLYSQDVDYAFDKQANTFSALNDFILLPESSLYINESKYFVSFLYEVNYVLGKDFKADLHKESINEFIDNKLLSPTKIQTNYSPITNVFKVFNQTTGEIYNVVNFDDNTISFTGLNLPKITDVIQEKISFEQIVNEFILVKETLINASTINVFKIKLDCDFIVSSTDDSIGSISNSSVYFSNSNTFVKELYYNGSIDSLLSIGEYMIDYESATIYVAVSNIQNFDVGYISYKSNKIKTEQNHIISVNNVYFKRTNLSSNKIEKEYDTFSDNTVVLKSLPKSAELYLNDSVINPYQIVSNKVGAYNNAVFYNTVSDYVSGIYGLFEYNDYINSKKPLNFSSVSSFQDKEISVSEINESFIESIQSDGYLYVQVPFELQNISPNINYNISIVRISDSAQLWNGSGTIVTGDMLRFNLPGINTPLQDQVVQVNLTISINNLSRVVVDYLRGIFYIDYTFLNDEILVSYEYGDNVLDFSNSLTILQGDNYYVSYKVGALRDALDKNFANILGIDDLLNFSLDINRENYRDILLAGMTSFIKGPTNEAVKNIASKISHLPSNLFEGLFNHWSLGESYLSKSPINTYDTAVYKKAKFDNGLEFIKNQSIKVSGSNTFADEGTFEAWVTPYWNGLDSNADVSFTVVRDGLAMPISSIFIGGDELHPTSNVFDLNKNSFEYFTIPNKNKDGVYIYLKDNQWVVDCIDGYSDGYGVSHNYYITVTSSNAQIYNAQVINGFTTTINNKISLTTSSSNFTNTTLTFYCDYDHYILDCEIKDCKLSLFKDVNGYLVFKIKDLLNNTYQISSNVQLWNANENHLIAISWKLNSPESQDFMRLFIDGKQCANIVTFNQKQNVFTNIYSRDVAQDPFVHNSSYDVVGSTDLLVTSGSNIVTSSINFNSFNISAGNTLYILEDGFNPSGYTISTVSGQSLILSSSMPLSIDAAKFSINRKLFKSNVDLDLYNRFALFRIGVDLQATVDVSSNIITSVSNFETLGFKKHDYIYLQSKLFEIKNVIGNTIYVNSNLVNQTGITARLYKKINEKELQGVKAIKPDYTYDGYVNIDNGLISNDLCYIKTYGLNHKYESAENYVWADGYSSSLLTKLKAPVSIESIDIHKVILNKISLNSSNSTILSNILTYTNNNVDQPIISDFGRTISFDLYTNNIDFSNCNVFIDGYLNATYQSETINITSSSVFDTVQKYTTINSIVFTGELLSNTKPAGNLYVYEKNNITTSESNSSVATINFSYVMRSGENVNLTTNYITDGYFSSYDVGNILVVTYPTSHQYKITNVSDDKTKVYLSELDGSSVSTTVSNLRYYILNTTVEKSGIQNGFIYLLKDNKPYYLTKGLYKIKYPTYVNININEVKSFVIGNDLTSRKSFNGLIEKIKMMNISVDDIHVGEVNASINSTSEYNKIKGYVADKYTTLYLPLSANTIDYSDYYIKYNSERLLSDNKPNDKFDQSALYKNNFEKLENNGLFLNEGCIEFWINPIFDTGNDPNVRYYFDAFGDVSEELISSTKSTIKLNGNANKILSIKIPGSNFEYATGSYITIDGESSIKENINSLNSTSLKLSKAALQIVSIKIQGDRSNTEYVFGSVLDVDKKTIYLSKSLPQTITPLIVSYKTIDNKIINQQLVVLNKELPSENCKVIVTYLPTKSQGDRLSLFKDKNGLLHFSIKASNVDCDISCPISWKKNSWHKVRASYKFNSLTDESMKLWVDGYERTNTNLTNVTVDGYFGSYSGKNSVNSISFKDKITQVTIAANYLNSNNAFAYFNNLRISDSFRPGFNYLSESLDPTYIKNIEAAFPVVNDIYTTYIYKNDLQQLQTNNFTTLSGEQSSSNEFTLRIHDGLNVISSYDILKSILQQLVSRLKPANSKVYFEYK